MNNRNWKGRRRRPSRFWSLNALGLLVSLALQRKMVMIWIANKQGGNSEIIEDFKSIPTAPTTKKKKSLEIPVADWPIPPIDLSNNDEMDVILHPGDLKSTMRVPKFWSAPMHNKTHNFTLQDANMIGTCAKTNGASILGKNCPKEDRTIYVAIASYRDFQCRETVESVFRRAKHPHRLRVAVVDQIADGDVPCDEPVTSCKQDPSQNLCRFSSQIEVFRLDSILSVGPVLARHIGNRLYRGEHYAFQTDAHVTFVRNWDEKLVDEWEATGNEMAVLSTYMLDVQKNIDSDTGESNQTSRAILCSSHFVGVHRARFLRHGIQPMSPPTVTGKPQLCPFWAAGLSFGRGHFVVNVPYDQHLAMIFQGEEISMTIRGFTVGYDFYAPEHNVCFHHYAKGANLAARKSVRKFQEHGTLYPGANVRSLARLLGIIHMNKNPTTDSYEYDRTDENRYGLGNVRTTEQFYALYGIDVVNKKSQGNMCLFVDNNEAQMHRLFEPHLRTDAMGIDYSHPDISSFQWRDPGLPPVKRVAEKKKGL